MYLYAFGTFLFGLRSLPVSGFERGRDFRHPTVDRVGARAASQFAGPGEDTITLSGVMPLVLTGGKWPVETLNAIANSGESRMLVTGYGEVLGSYVITSTKETHREMFGDGMPRVIEYDVTFRRVDDPVETA